MQESQERKRILEMLVCSVSFPAWNGNNGHYLSDDIWKRVRKMRNRYICEYCKGRLDPGEKCDCQKMRNRNYTAIEGAGYKPAVIRPISYYNKKPAE